MAHLESLIQRKITSRTLCAPCPGLGLSANLTLHLPVALQNLKRVAEVWMDEYAEHIYQRRPEYRHLSAGDVAAQKKLRSSLNCKSFKWFMTKIAWDLPKFYPPVEPPAAAWGEVSAEGRASYVIGRRDSVLMGHRKRCMQTRQREEQMLPPRVGGQAVNFTTSS